MSTHLPNIEDSPNPPQECVRLFYTSLQEKRQNLALMFEVVDLLNDIDLTGVWFNTVGWRTLYINYTTQADLDRVIGHLQLSTHFKMLNPVSGLYQIEKVTVQIIFELIK